MWHCTCEILGVLFVRDGCMLRIIMRKRKYFSGVFWGVDIVELRDYDA